MEFVEVGEEYRGPLWEFMVLSDFQKKTRESE